MPAYSTGVLIGELLTRSGEPPPVTFYLALPPLMRLVDANNGGKGRISGFVTKEGTPSDTPVSRRVRLYLDRDGVLISETWSSPIDGSYSFNNINETRQYYVVAFDHTAFYNAVIGDLITPDIT